MSRRAFLGLGCNLGDCEATLRAAIARIDAIPGVNFLRASHVYETEPMGVTDQPSFLNMVIEVEISDEITICELFEQTKRFESELGRKRRERWGPREIDIDILLVKDEQIQEEGLEVPHPRMWERAFVIVPLAELAPELVGPGGKPITEIASRLQDGQGVCVKFQS